jgi:hypothetical protein
MRLLQPHTHSTAALAGRRRPPAGLCRGCCWNGQRLHLLLLRRLLLRLLLLARCAVAITAAAATAAAVLLSSFWEFWTRKNSCTCSVGRAG